MYSAFTDIWQDKQHVRKLKTIVTVVELRHLQNLPGGCLEYFRVKIFKTFPWHHEDVSRGL